MAYRYLAVVPIQLGAWQLIASEVDCTPAQWTTFTDCTGTIVG